MTNPIDTMAIAACRADGKDPYEPDYMHRVEGRPGPPQWLEYRGWAEWYYENFGAKPEGTQSDIPPLTYEVISYVRRYGGFCRDCADEKGICPYSGLPCHNGQQAIRHVIVALRYGLHHGFIRPDGTCVEDTD